MSFKIFKSIILWCLISIAFSRPLEAPVALQQSLQMSIRSIILTPNMIVHSNTDETSKHNYQIVLRKSYEYPVFLLGMTSFGVDPHLQSTTHDGSFKVQIRAYPYQLENLNIEIILSGSIQIIKICYLAIEKQLTYEAGLYHHQYNPQIKKQQQQQQNKEKQLMIDQQQNYQISIDLIIKNIRSQSIKFQKIKKLIKKNDEVQKMNMKAISYLRQYQYRQGQRNVWKLITTIEKGNISVIFLNQFRSKKQFPKFTLTLLIENQKNSAIQLDITDVNYLANIPQRLSLQHQIGFIGLSSIESSHQCNLSSLLNTISNEEEGYYIKFQDKNRKCDRKISFSVVSFNLAEMQVSQSQITSRMLLTCTGSFYPTFYQNYWLEWIDPIKRTVETCQPCPAGCLTCSFCAKCYRFVTCDSCVAGTYRKQMTYITQIQYVCRCPDNNWISAVTNQCYLCNVLHPGCGANTCTGVVTNHYTSLCTYCNPGYYGPTKIKIPYWQGFTSCGECPSGCSACTSATLCSACSSTTLVIINNICQCKTASTYYSSSTKSCVACGTLYPNCASCVNITTATNCTSCQNGFYLSSITTCTACQPNCNICTSTVCTSCASLYIPSGANCICDSISVYQTSSSSCKICSTVITNCNSCTNNTITCLMCASGYYLNTPTSCLTCPTPCSTCNSILICTGCKNSIILDNNTCICNISNNQVYLPTINDCVSCGLYKTSCSICDYDVNTTAIECTTCNIGFYLTLNPSTCNLCKIQCTQCTSYAICTNCIVGYALNNATFQCQCTNCLYCNTTLNLPNCAVCSAGIPDVCTDCMAGSYVNSTNGTYICESCPVGCATCTNDTNCNSCLYPFIINSLFGCQCNYLSLQYYNPSNSNCSSCMTIIPFCLSCTSSNYVTVCNNCINGYFVNETICSACVSPCDFCFNATACETCVSTFTLQGTECICNSTQAMFYDYNTGLCALCQNIMSSLCQVCTNQSLSPNGIKCQTCVDGYFTNSTSYGCDICPQTCKTCTSQIICTDCINNYELINGTCSCNISNNMYPTYRTCAICQSIINYCISCQYLNDMTICLDCIQGTYLSADNKSCIICQQNCASCDQTGCLNCLPGFYNHSSGLCYGLTTCSGVIGPDPNCLDCNQIIDLINNTMDTFCYACSPGYFNVNNYTCQICQTSCMRCTQYVLCTICMPSFTLINGQCICDNYQNQILYQQKCYDCAALITGCQKCITTTNVSCTFCIRGYVLVGITCNACQIGCLICDASLFCITCMPDHTLNMGICTSLSCNSSLGLYYSANNNSCQTCHPWCIVCISQTICISCNTSIPNVKNIYGVCQCPEGLNYFYNDLTSQCTDCSTLPHLSNCRYCIKEVTPGYPQNIGCTNCLEGYYLNNSKQCSQCQSGCKKCVNSFSCYSCNGPKWVMDNTTCVCNRLQNYFANNMSDCQLCTLDACTICTNLTTCFSCQFGYFVNSSGICQLAVCSNGVVEGGQECDDGNLVNDDGCSSNCTIQLYYFCQNSPSICQIDYRFNVKINSIKVDCNQITYQFVIYPYYSAYDNGIYNNFLISQDRTEQNLIKWNKKNDKIYYTYGYSKHIQNLTVTFVFDSQYLGIYQTSTFPRNTVTFIIEPTNNMKAYYYQSSVCQTKQSFETVQKAVQYSSYGLLILSALPGKIIGLQLFGVLQLAFISIGSLDNVNMLLSPMASASGVNGFKLDLSENSSKKRLLQTSNSLTPERVASIGYKSNFIRNCNVMLLLVIFVIVISFILYLVTCIFKSCFSILHKISKRLIKEVLLTLILFNIFNFAYSVGLHFRYADVNDQLYLLGSIAAIAALIIPTFIVLALMISEQEGFGEFKDKLKNGCMQKGYFVFTIIYRICVGLYLSSSNQDELSTLIVLAFSISFLMYNLINLPFVKAYHNYRANVCHLCQFICLFIIMYYRSMVSTSDEIRVSTIFSPVYIWYICIIISLIVSLIVLIYEILIWIKQCMITKAQKHQNIDQSIQNNLHDKQKLHENGQNQTIEFIEERQKKEQIAFEMYNIYQ